MPTFEHDGLRLAYRDDGAGPPFVFQHGLGGDAAQPATHAPAGCRLVTLECRGHGDSPLGPETALGFETFADDLGALIDALGLPPILLGGISMGAGVALALARRRPEQVRALVLVRPAWVDHASPPNLRVFREIAALLRAHGPVAGKELFVTESPGYRHAQSVSPAVARSLAAQFDRPAARERAAVLERLPADRPLRDAADWDALTMPALVLGARPDGVHPFDAAVAVAGLLPHACVREIPSKEAGEAAHRRAVAAAIVAFAADVAAAAVVRA